MTMGAQGAVRWDNRIERAELLREQQPWASEVLAFYGQVLRLQKRIFETADFSKAARCEGGFRESLEFSSIVEWYPELCCVVRQHGTSTMRERVGEFSGCSGPEVESLLKAVVREQEVSEMGRMLGLAVLQPYAGRLAARRDPPAAESGRKSCPVCDGRPLVGVLRPEGDGGKRWLVCSFCLTEWEFRRILCPYCGEQDYSRLPVFTPAERDSMRVHACQTCRRYLKVVDMTVDGHAEAMVDEMAAAPLDVWAAEQGYQKIESNLLGY